jgi:DNA repair protein RecN (Recombination protein N)
VHLNIKNVALIEELNLEFGEGFNILTGETGAGKSIIIDSINAIIGNRISRETIRTGEEKAIIEAVFCVERNEIYEIFDELGIQKEDDNIVIVSREIFISGRNICRINGKIVTVSVLKRIGELVIDIHGQYDNQSLLRTDYHVVLLDYFGGDAINKLKEKYLLGYNRYNSLVKRKLELSGIDGQREQKIDILNYQIKEIENSNIKINEDIELKEQRDILANAEKIKSVLNSVYLNMYTGNNNSKSATDMFTNTIHELKTISEFNSVYLEILKKVEDIFYSIEDVTEDVRAANEFVEYDDGLLNEIEDRIDVINNLKRKYGNTINDINTYLEKSKKELDEILKADEILKDIDDEINILTNQLKDMAIDIYSERKKSSTFLETKIKKELEDLQMKNSIFKVLIDHDLKNFRSDGFDKVEFMISTNLGEPVKPLSKIASGGEMSRIMLAVKCILASADKIPTLIFDEIDSGISGYAAQKVSEKLSEISKFHQVICVTHLAQIASMADNHFYISKTSNKNTYTKIKKLNNDEIKEEISRLLSGDSSQITLRHAEELIKKANNYKKS